MSSEATEIERILTRLINRRLAKIGLAGVQFATIPSSFSTGNPTLLLPQELAAALPAGTKAHKVVAPFTQRLGAPAAGQIVAVTYDNDENRIVAGKIVDLSAVVVDSDYLMGVRPVAPGNTVLLSANTERSTTSATFVEAKSFFLSRPGRYRFVFDMTRTGGQSDARIAFERPDGTIEPASSTASHSGVQSPTYPAAFTLDMNVSLPWGGFVRLEYRNASGGTAFVRNCSVRYADASAAITVYDAVRTD